MGYKLKKKHTKVNYSSGNSGRDYLVIHYTGNKTDTAAANANYFYSVNRQASAHYFVDDRYVYEVVSPSDTSWAVGVDYGGKLFSKCKNRNSISIEMCGTNGKVSDKTYTNTVTLTKKLMKKYGISASHVVRHYDVCNKACPGWKGWIPKDESVWKKFKKAISGTTSTSGSTKSTVRAIDSGKVTASAGLNVRKGAGTSYGIVKTLAKGTTVKCYEKKTVSGTVWWKISADKSYWVSSKYIK